MPSSSPWISLRNWRCTFMKRDAFTSIEQCCPSCPLASRIARPRMKVITASVRDWGYGGEDDADIMSDGKVVLVVLDVADVLLSGVKEDGGGSKVIRWRIKTYDEAAGEEVLTAHLIVGVRVDEDVGEGSGCVSHIATSVEHAEEITNLSIDS